MTAPAKCEMVKKNYAMIFRNYLEDSADESISSIKDLSSTKGEEDMYISDIEGSGSIGVVGEVNYAPETR